MCDNASIPTARELFHGTQFVTNIVSLVIGVLFFLATLVVYIELVIFIHRHFKQPARQIRTTWILAIYPVFSGCCLVAVFVPRSTTIVDLVNDVFLASCLYQFLMLLVDYLGNEEEAWKSVKDTAVRINTPPLCCCLICLPTVKFSRKFLSVIKVMVIQVIVVRPILSFLAAVMWADGVYTPGHISVTSGFIYITSVNAVSSVTAVWGLFLLRSAFQPLLQPYQTAGKFMVIQFVILLTVIPNIIIGLLVNTDAIPCIDQLPSKSRGDRIHHGLVLCAMLPLIILARHFYRRKWEGGYGMKVEGEGTQNKLEMRNTPDSANAMVLENGGNNNTVSSDKNS